ncbi:MAG: hypothetical protein PUG21_00590 [Prevotella sp.]|nr:hypothetical protein [Prevotella sp.]
MSCKKRIRTNSYVRVYILSTEALTPGFNVNYSVVVSKSEVVVFCDGIFEWETEDGGDYSPPFFNPNVVARVDKYNN